MLKACKKAARAALPAPWGRLSGSDQIYTCLYHLVRLGLGCLFIYAGFIKLLDPKAFAHAIAQFDLAPEPLLPLLAVGLPALELLAGAGLIFQVRGSLTVIAVLMGLFLVVLGYAVFMEMDIDCGCFTAEDLAAKTGVRQALVRDLFLAAALAFLFHRRRRGACRPSSIKPEKLTQGERRKK